MNSNRALSRMTKTTAASVNNTMLNDKRNQSNIFGSPNKTNFSHAIIPSDSIATRFVKIKSDTFKHNDKNLMIKQKK